MSGSRSGIKVDDACNTAFNKLKMGKGLRYVAFKMSEDHSIVQVEAEVAKSGSPEDQFKEFRSKLPAKDGRYYIYDFEYNNADNDIRNKVALILWCPDATPIKTKMLYTTTKDDFKKKLQGLQIEMQATDFDEITWDAIIARCQK